MKKRKRKGATKTKLTKKEREAILSYSKIKHLVERDPELFENLSDEQLIKMRDLTKTFINLYPKTMPKE